MRLGSIDSSQVQYIKDTLDRVNNWDAGYLRIRREGEEYSITVEPRAKGILGRIAQYLTRLFDSSYNVSRAIKLIYKALDSAKKEAKTDSEKIPVINALTSLEQLGNTVNRKRRIFSHVSLEPITTALETLGTAADAHGRITKSKQAERKAKVKELLKGNDTKAATEYIENPDTGANRYEQFELFEAVREALVKDGKIDEALENAKAKIQLDPLGIINVAIASARFNHMKEASEIAIQYYIGNDEHSDSRREDFLEKVLPLVQTAEDMDYLVPIITKIPNSNSVNAEWMRNKRDALCARWVVKLQLAPIAVVKLLESIENVIVRDKTLESLRANWTQERRDEVEPLIRVSAILNRS